MPTVHEKLAPLKASLVKRIRIRQAGFDEAGGDLGPERRWLDLRLVHALESQLLVRPGRIDSGGENQARETVPSPGEETPAGTRPWQLLARGGHISHVPVAKLRHVCQVGGYVLLAEYVEGGRRVPVGYQTGFTSLPVDDPLFPNLDARTIDAPADEVNRFVARSGSTWVIWRTGVLRILDRQMTGRFAGLGVHVPGHLEGRSFQRLGMCNAFKRVAAVAARNLNKQLILFNVTELRTSGESAPAGGAINVPSVAANEGVCPPLGYGRTHVDAVAGMPDLRVYWWVFGNDPAAVLQGLQTETGVLQGKGGWNLQRLDRAGQNLASTLGKERPAKWSS